MISKIPLSICSHQKEGSKVLSNLNINNATRRTASPVNSYKCVESIHIFVIIIFIDFIFIIIIIIIIKMITLFFPPSPCLLSTLLMQIPPFRNTPLVYIRLQCTQSCLNHCDGFLPVISNLKNNPFSGSGY